MNEFISASFPTKREMLPTPPLPQLPTAVKKLVIEEGGRDGGVGGEVVLRITDFKK